MNDLLLAMAVATAGTASVVYAVRRLGGAVGPGALFLAVWTICLSLYALRLLPYRSLRPLTVAILAASIVAFVTGVAVGRLPGWHQVCARAGAWYRQSATHSNRSITLGLLLVLLIAGLISSTIYVFQVTQSLGPLAFVLSLGAVRRLKPDLHYPAVLLWGAAMYVWYLAAGAGRETVGGMPRWTVWVAPVALVPFLISTGRTELFFVAITALVAWSLRQGPDIRLTTRQFTVVTAVAVGLLGAFVGLSFLLGKVSAVVALGYGFPRGLILLVDPYIYASAAIPAFDHLVGDMSLAGNAAGPFTFWPVHRVLYALGAGAEPVNWVADFVEIPMLANVFTFLEPFLRDYGPVGCVIGPFVVGLIGSCLHQIALAGGTAGARLPYAIYAFAIVFSPFVNHFSQLVVPFLIFTTVVLTFAASQTAGYLSRQVRA